MVILKKLKIQNNNIFQNLEYFSEVCPKKGKNWVPSFPLFPTMVGGGWSVAGGLKEWGKKKRVVAPPPLLDTCFRCATF